MVELDPPRASKRKAAYRMPRGHARRCQLRGVREIRQFRRPLAYIATDDLPATAELDRRG